MTILTWARSLPEGLSFSSHFSHDRPNPLLPGTYIDDRLRDMQIQGVKIHVPLRLHTLSFREFGDLHIGSHSTRPGSRMGWGRALDTGAGGCAHTNECLSTTRAKLLGRMVEFMIQLQPVCLCDRPERGRKGAVGGKYQRVTGGWATCMVLSILRETWSQNLGIYVRGTSSPTSPRRTGIGRGACTWYVFPMDVLCDRGRG